MSDIVKLITIEDIIAYKPMSINTDVTKKLNTFIQEAQEFDVASFLGDAFYMALENDFIAQPSLTIYSDLFNGCSYVYDGITYRHRGVKAMLVYYTYSRYIANSQSNQTAFGVVAKNNTDSTPVTDKTIARLADQAQAGAEKYKRDLEQFLNLNYTNYPLWYNRIANRTKSASIRVSSVGGNNRKVASSYRCVGCGRYTNCIC
ncbi:hypothetical protein UFOVP606_15 [uncultured Caudovirales phage]|uniref:Uncharacterized protein n=1 Tax=uncultured Caudovirales phage TaxID=2100421 RepID=A0A6J5NAE2_9CAUD|nr:hypothetical protein UFOVP606_15 [uncultured Caudovirales phage]